ncbi:GNAT family N-acetyltransferase [Sphingomonas lenta]|uniref:Glycosyl transferase family 1 n=1 Tax=Sphingomonas lenta TaxID=1141887 RepID=A0A2A2SFG5_9SPHN|nr:GNAT family N-acetyltransferase [Sphingomonas lenta]PAX08044.1 glycosyl transferase family 1 [Sphingomonas lenta]
MTRDEWWDLHRRDPRATPFQSPAWAEAWWTHLGGGERLDAEVRDASGRLVAALPLFVWNDERTRRLVPVGAGHSDYLDALIDPDADALPAIWDTILATADRWDELLLPDLRPDSPLLGPVPSGWRAADEPHEVCPVMPLPDAPPLLAGMSKSKRRKVQHDRNRADALGGVTEELVDAHGLDEALDALFALHAARWEAAGELGVLADPRIQAFHRAAAPALMEAGLLRVGVVRHHGCVVAVLLGFADGRRGYSYINGVDQSIPGQSFGTLAFRLLIEDALGNGARAFHFLRGEEPYKYAWGAEPLTTVRRRVTRA